MIAIINVRHIKGDLYEYEVRINKTLITNFQHNRKDGLSVCLNKASIAVSNCKNQEYMNNSQDIYQLYSGYKNVTYRED